MRKGMRNLASESPEGTIHPGLALDKMHVLAHQPVLQATARIRLMLPLCQTRLARKQVATKPISLPLSAAHKPRITGNS